MFGSIGFTELILILFIVLIIFGAGKLPQLGEGIGKAIKGFKKSVHEAEAIEAEAQAQAQGEAPPLLRLKSLRSLRRWPLPSICPCRNRRSRMARKRKPTPASLVE